jgi:hypothetical protein
MTATIISNTPPFGLMTNEMVANLHTVNEQMTRLQEAVATAASGYGGTAGTEYEGNSTNFGVLASATPGEQGSNYAFALNTLANDWVTFWTAAVASIQQLDNGVTSP